MELSIALPTSYKLNDIEFECRRIVTYTGNGKSDVTIILNYDKKNRNYFG